MVEQHNRFMEELGDRRIWSYRLQPGSEARTVHMDAAGQLSVMDGPFTETKEVIGGLYLIEAESMDEAVEWARKSRFIPGANEVRPIWEA